MRHREAGFALLGVLWIIVAMSTASLGVTLAAREGIANADREMSARRARWLAEACTARVRAEIARALAERPERAGIEWRTLDHRLRGSGFAQQSCAITARGAGTRLALPTATRDELAGIPGMTDELSDRILDLAREGRLPDELVGLQREISEDAWSVLSGNYADFARMVTLDPEAWTIAVRTNDPAGRVRASLQTHFVRAGTRAAVLRQRWL